MHPSTHPPTHPPTYTGYWNPASTRSSRKHRYINVPTHPPTQTIQGHIERCASHGIPLLSPLTGEPMQPELLPARLIHRIVGEYVAEKKEQWRQLQQLQGGGT